jgi:ABC-2 type transport system ATP-binding protein
MANGILEVYSLTYSYGSYQALREATFTVNKNEIMVIAGPNGAGKTTLLLCLAGLLRPTTGNVLIEGNDLYKEERIAKKRLAFVPDVPRFYQGLTAWEHLQFIALAHIADEGFDKRAEKLLSEFGLWEVRNMFPYAFSRGMRLKLGIILALIRPFSVLLMDEPTSALDPEGTAILRKKITDLSVNGAAIIITTHDLSLMDELGERTALMQGGYLDID